MRITRAQDASPSPPLRLSSRPAPATRGRRGDGDRIRDRRDTISDVYFRADRLRLLLLHDELGRERHGPVEPADPHRPSRVIENDGQPVQAKNLRRCRATGSIAASCRSSSTTIPIGDAVASQPCIKNNVVTQNPAPGSDLIAIYSGGASDIVIVTACYKWDFTSKLPFFKLGNMTDGSMMMQTATAFRSEPYPGT